MDAAVQEAKDQAELNELLIWASARGLLADAIELIARGAEPQVRDKQGFLPAHYAAAHGHLDLLQYLATKGADVEAEDAQARMPLHHAVLSGSVEVLRFLVQRSTWLDAADGADDTALHLAARRGWVPGVKLLLAGAASPNIPNKRGLSALGEAVAGGHAAAAEVLLQAGADAGCRAAGYTLLHIAAGMGHTDLLHLLQQQPSCSPLVNDAANDDSATPLHAAAMAGAAACVQLLLQHGADASVAGAGGLLPWEVVTADTPELQQQLVQQLQDAAGSSSSSSSKKPGSVYAGSTTSISKDAAAARASAEAAADAAIAASNPAAAYSVQFAALNATEQGRKVDTFARMSEQELGQLDFLSAEAKQAINQVRRAQQLLTCYRAVAALRSDESFQEDASDPEVQKALHEMAIANSFDKHKGDRHIMAVAAKLKKFHSVMQECGMRLGLQEVLVKPGQTLAQLMEQDAEQVKGLTAAAAAARNAAVAAISGRPTAAPAAETAAAGEAAKAAAGAAGAVAGVKKSTAVSAEIQPEAPADAEGAELDLDLQLQRERAAAAAAAAAAKPRRKALEEMGVGERMRYEVVNSFKQAVKIMCMVFVLWGVMWCLGLMPYQQDPQALEQRMQQMIQAKQAAQQQQQQQGMAAGAAHNEL